MNSDKPAREIKIDGIAFRSLPGAEKYLISACGKVFSSRSKKYLKLRNNLQGYLGLTIHYDNGRSSTHNLSRLILHAWVGKPPEGYQAAHLDGNKDNNHLSNLKWVSRKENEAHKLIHGTRPIGLKHGRAKLNEETVQYIRENFKMRTPYISNRIEIAAKLNVHPSTVTNVITNRHWANVPTKATALLGESEGEE